MKNNLIKILFFLVFVCYVFGEFELMKRSRGYNEAVDFLTIKIKKTTCEEFLKKGGLGEKIRGGRSHHCLPIDSKGKDVDELKFVGRCLNNDKDLILSIFEVKNKRSHDDGKKHRSFISTRKNDDENVEFYLSLRTSDKPIEFKIKHFNLKNGHAYQVRRPKCIKARNYCSKHKSEDSKEEMMVIDCDRQKQAKGSVDKNDRVYIEITRREKRPDTCSDSKNGHCCRYVNANPKGGICKLYARKNGNDYSKEENNKHGNKDNIENSSSATSNSPKHDDEEPILVKENESVDNLLKDLGVNDAKKETSNNESAKEDTPSTDKKEASEDEGEEFEENEEVDSKNNVDSKQNSQPITSTEESTPNNNEQQNNLNNVVNNNNNNNNEVVAAPSNPEKRQASEEEDPEFDMFEDEEVDKKNVVEKPSPVVPIIRKNEPNTIVIPNLKKKKKNQIKSVVEQSTPIVPIKQVEQQPTPVVPIKQVEQQSTPVVPIKQVEQQPTPIVPIKQVEQPTPVEVAPATLVKDLSDPK